MQCKCGASLQEGAKFCSECGKRAPKPKPPQQQFADNLMITQVKPILKPAEAATLLGISRWKLDELRKQGKLPPSSYFQIPSSGSGKFQTYRYRAKELLEWSEDISGPITTAG